MEKVEPDSAQHARERFGRNVRVARVERGMTQDRLASETGMPRTHVSGIELGKKNPSLITILRLAAALEVPAEDLMRDVTL